VALELAASGVLVADGAAGVGLPLRDGEGSNELLGADAFRLGAAATDGTGDGATDGHTQLLNRSQVTLQGWKPLSHGYWPQQSG
jgi:hypothetical protein